LICLTGGFMKFGKFSTGKLLFLILTISFNTFAATITWSGNGSDNKFSNPANWIGNVVPVSGDSLIFPANAAHFSVNNDLTPHNSTWSSKYASATFEGGNYQLSGNRFNVQDAFVLSGAQVSGNLGVITMTVRTLTGSTGASTTFQNDLGLVIDGAGTNFITISRGQVDSTVKNGIGKTTLYKGSFDYQGDITINGGILEISNFSTSGNFVTNLEVNSGTFQGQAGVSRFSAQTSSAIVKPSHILALNLFLTNGAKFIPTIKCTGGAVGTFRINLVSGQATITGSILEPVLAPNCNPMVGYSWSLIGSGSPDFGTTLTGTFAGLPEGSRILVSGIPFRLTYNGANAQVELLRIPTTKFDYDGDGKADASVFRQNDSNWYLSRSTSGFSQTPFGISTDKLVPADYDGDGKTDIAVYRDGVWYAQLSSGGIYIFQFGLADDIPVAADYDGDNKTDFAVYRGGVWYVQQSRDGFKAIQFGLPNDKPVSGDFDGDNKADFAVYRDGVWYLLQSTNGYSQFQFGLAGDKPVTEDYDGDGKTDAAVFREGVWYFLLSQTGFVSTQFGQAGDKPAPADYDGDGKTDIGFFRGGDWYILKSTGGVSQFHFGLAGDVPIPNVYNPQ